MRHRGFGVVAAAGAIVMLGACSPPPPDPAPPVIDHVAIASTALSDPALVPIEWTVHDANGDILTCRLDGDGDGDWDLTISPCPLSGSRNISAGQGDHTARFQVTDGAHAPVTATADYSVAAGPTEPFDIVAIQTEPADPRVDEAIATAIARWESVIVRGVPDTHVYNEAGTGPCGSDSPAFDGMIDDLVVYVDVQPDPGAFATADNCAVGPDLLPRLSFIRLNEASITWFHDSGHLDDLVAHEMGHALGFAGYVWNTLAPNPGSSTPTWSGPRAVAEYSTLGGTGQVPIEPGTGSGHWDERVFQSELMSCYIEADVGQHPLSALTVAAMADIGHHVDISAAEPYQLPASLGNASC